MHEYSLVEALVRRVGEEARRRGALAVHALRVSVGELAGVDPELFRTAYETFRAGTMCETAALELVVKPAAWSCPRCGEPIAKGEEKPLKYPVMFQKADLVLVTKVDLVPHLDVDLAKLRDALARVMPDPKIIEVSARTGDGIEAWKAW